MAKSQKKSNREVRKPSQKAAKGGAAPHTIVRPIQVGKTPNIGKTGGGGS